MTSKNILILIWAILSVSAFSCTDLEPDEDCNIIPDFDFQKDTVCLVPCSVTFIDRSDINKTIGTILLDPDDGTEAVDMIGTYQHTYESPGVYDVTMTVIALTCDPKPITKRVIVGVDPPTAAFTPSSNFCTLIQEDCTISFTNESLKATSYEWYFNEELRSTDEAFSHTFTEPDTIEVRLVAINDEGERDEDSETIIIRPLTVKLTALDLDDDMTVSETIYGVDEAGNGDFYLIMNNGTLTYLAKTDQFGTLIGEPIGVGFDGTDYSNFEPLDFAKTSTGYLLAGKTLTPNFNADMFVFKASLTLSSGQYQAMFRPISSDTEEAFSVVENNLTGNYVAGGRGAFQDGLQGMYVYELNSSMNPVSFTPILQPDPGASIKAMRGTQNGYWLVGNEDLNTIVFAKLANNFTATVNPINIGNSQISLDKIIELSNTSVVVIGNTFGAGAAAVAIKIDITGTTASIDWNENYPDRFFRNALFTSDGRLICIGQEPSSGLPMLTEINLVSGKEKPEKLETFQSNDFDEGEFYHLIETSDKGFFIGGKGRKTSQKYKSIFIKTDKNGND